MYRMQTANGDPPPPHPLTPYPHPHPYTHPTPPSHRAQTPKTKNTYFSSRGLENSGVAAGDVNYVNAHATSTLAGDMAEYRAITSALPNPDLRMNSTKSLIGHLLGAAGAVEAVATIQAIRTGQDLALDFDPGSCLCSV